MTNFVYVYYNDRSISGAPTEEGKAAWGAWFGSLGEKLVDGGNQFKDGGKIVEKSGISEIENYPATGYSIIKAENMDAAMALVKDCPLLDVPGGAVRVYETLPM